MNIKLPDDEGIVASSKTRVRCVYCAVLIPKAKKSIKEHIWGGKHLKNTYTMIHYGIYCANNDNVLHCKPCDRALSKKESVVEHFKEETHSFWMDALKVLVDRECFEVKSFLRCYSDSLYCEACDENVNCSLECIKEHVKRIDHQTKAVKALAPRNGIFNLSSHSDSDGDGECNEDEEVIKAWCKICDKNINNTTQDFFRHIDDDNHRLWLTHVYSLINYQISIMGYLTSKEVTAVYCDRCEVHFPCTILTIHEHIHSEPHLRL